MTIRRRAVLSAPIGLVGAALLGRGGALLAQDADAALPARDPSGKADDAVQALLDRWQTLVDEWEAAPDASDAYVYRLCGLLAGAAPDVVPRQQRIVYDREGLQTGPAWFSGPLFVVELRLEPGAVIRPHNHPVLHVVTLALEGSCRYEQYDPGPGAPPYTVHDVPFALRRTRAGVLLPGRVANLTRTRDNVHTFVAGTQGATLLDFSMNAVPGSNSNDFSQLDISEQPMEADADFHQARWIGKP